MSEGRNRQLLTSDIGSILVTLDLFTLTIKCVGEGREGGGGWWWYWNILTIQG